MAKPKNVEKQSKKTILNTEDNFISDKERGDMHKRLDKIIDTKGMIILSDNEKVALVALNVGPLDRVNTIVQVFNRVLPSDAESTSLLFLRKMALLYLSDKKEEDKKFDGMEELLKMMMGK